MHSINKAQAFFYVAFYNRLFYLWGYIKKFLAVFSIKDEILGMRLHIYLLTLFNSFKNLSAKRLHSFRARSSGAPIETAP
jgi:hypothetical protein